MHLKISSVKRRTFWPVGGWVNNGEAKCLCGWKEFHFNTSSWISTKWRHRPSTFRISGYWRSGCLKKILRFVHWKSAKHDDVIKWKHFPRYWPFVRGIHRSPVNSLHKGQWRGALMFSLICARINGWVNNREADDLRRYRAQYDVIVMYSIFSNYIKGWWHIHKICKHVFFSRQFIRVIMMFFMYQDTFELYQNPTIYHLRQSHNRCTPFLAASAMDNFSLQT